MNFSKYHALGNDYLVINPNKLKDDLTKEKIRIICHRNYGIGSDGILLGPLASSSCDFALKIFNPDGSEAEKSGNGLRIFARYLCDSKIASSNSFTIETAGGNVFCEVHQNKEIVTVNMGRVSFNSQIIPVTGKPREVLNETLQIKKKYFTFSAATIGNPHCVIFSENPTQKKQNYTDKILKIILYFLIGLMSNS